MDAHDILDHHTVYTVSTPVYEGPLDLLLQLIERAELDITKLALAQVTDQYLSYMRSMPERLPDEIAAEQVSSFLVIAAKLIQIKSEVLLPRPPDREPEEEDPGEVLARQLRLYKRFKEISIQLGERESAGIQTYLRIASPKKINRKFEFEGVALDDLVSALQAVFSQADKPQLGTVVSAPRITIREKIDLISDYLRKHRHGTFQQLLRRKGLPLRLEVVVTFLALLELVKLRLIQANQSGLFGEIELERTESWRDDEHFELEFGE